MRFKLGGKQFRADILIYDRQARPVMVVECKRPEVDIDQAVMDQAIRYNMVLNVKYILITNGLKTFICRREENDGSFRYVFVGKVPDYNEMVK